MEKQSRRDFLGLLVGALGMKDMDLISPPAYVPWFVRALRSDWRPPVPMIARMSRVEIEEFQRVYEAYWGVWQR